MIEILLILRFPLQQLVNETIGLGCCLESRYYSSGPSCLKGGWRYPTDKSLSNEERNWFP